MHLVSPGCRASFFSVCPFVKVYLIISMVVAYACYLYTVVYWPSLVLRLEAQWAWKKYLAWKNATYLLGGFVWLMELSSLCAVHVQVRLKWRWYPGGGILSLCLLHVDGGLLGLQELLKSRIWINHFSHGQFYSVKPPRWKGEYFGRPQEN